MDLFDTLGFRWDRSRLPAYFPERSIDRVCFRFYRMLPEFVWDAGMLEGNPYTLPEVKTLLDGVTVGGHRISDQEQILNLAESSRELLKLVRGGNFRLDKPTFCKLLALVARNEALEWGHFRGEGEEKTYTPAVALGEHGRYLPPETSSDLTASFQQGMEALTSVVDHPAEQGFAFFLFGALQQFFFDGNKRTSRLMMNGVLMSHGIDAISIPAARALEFNQKMVDFYVSREGTPMMQFLVECHPDAEEIQRHHRNRGRAMAS